MNLHRRYALSVNGSSPSGVQDASRQLLDGAGSGTHGSDYHGEIVAKDLVIESGAAQVSQARKRASH
jgi:hypothetical protein